MDSFYRLLEAVGYHHPIHPALVHLPLGLAIGAFVFQLLAVAARKPHLETTARHCVLLSLAGLVPAVALGFTDWQHFYAGAWLPAIRAKLLLAGALAAALAACAGRPRAGARPSRGRLLCAGVACVLAMALGYFGGELVYGGRQAPPGTETTAAGRRLFDEHCRGCHPEGGNALKPALPLRAAPQLADEDAFVAYLRSPRPRHGGTSLMPPFPTEKLSDLEARELWLFLTKTFGAP